jgi:iron(III) transport system permease protein
LVAVIFAILLIFILYPIVIVFIQSIGNDDGIGLDNYIKIFSDPYFKQAIINSIPVSLFSSIISTLLGLIIALVVFKTKLPGRKIFGFAAVLPMVIPGFALTLAYVFLFGRNGLITYKLLNITWNIYSWRSVLILQGLSISTTFFLISSVLVGVDSRVEDAARNLGASERTVFTTVTLPLIFPAVISATLLSFLRSLADFSTPYILGGSFNTLATEAYSQLIGTYNTPLASALSMILLVISILIFWLYTRSQKSSETVRTNAEGQPPKRLKLGKVAGGTMWLVSFTKHLGGDFELTLEHLKILPSRGWNSTRNSLVFASITSLVVTAFGLVLAYIRTRFRFRANKTLDLLATLPYAIPGTFMGIGYALAFNRPPLLLSGTWLIVVACTVIREVPMGLRAGVNVLMQQDRSTEDAASNLGASRLRAFFDVVVPAARPAILVTSLYAFIATVKTLGAIIFLMTPSNKVLSSDVFEATVRGDIGEASALSLVVILVCAVGMLLIFGINSRKATQKWFQNTMANLTAK